MCGFIQINAVRYITIYVCVFVKEHRWVNVLISVVSIYFEYMYVSSYRDLKKPKQFNDSNKLKQHGDNIAWWHTCASIKVFKWLADMSDLLFRLCVHISNNFKLARLFIKYRWKSKKLYHLQLLVVGRTIKGIEYFYHDLYIWYIHNHFGNNS